MSIEGVEKAAAVTSEYLSAFNPLNLIGGSVGTLAAATTPTLTEKELEEQARSGLSNMLVPGVGPYRYAKRLGHTAAKAGPAGYASTLMDIVGGGPATALLSGVLSSGQKPDDAFKIGLLTHTLPTLAGALAAAFTKRRTAEEQVAADRSIANNLAKLIPGVGTYNLFKRLGSTRTQDEAAEEQRKRELDKSIELSRKVRETGTGALGDLIARTKAVATA